MARVNPNDRYTINALRINIRDAIEVLKDAGEEPSVAIAITMLETALEVSDPKILDKDCGCG